MRYLTGQQGIETDTAAARRAVFFVSVAAAAPLPLRIDFSFDAV
jgi:hypothetical protein